jgi:hypothetical protein
MNIDPNKYANQRKRSSLKQNLFPEGMNYEEYMAQKNKKLQWDTKAEEIEIVPNSDGTVNQENKEGVSFISLFFSLMSRKDPIKCILKKLLSIV